MSLTKVSYSMIQGASANVLDFGAAGDGLADDTAAVQAAVDSGAAEVYFPSLCRVTTINVTSGVRLYGPGGLKKTAVRTDALLYITASNVEIDGLQFVGAGAGSTISTTVDSDNAIQINGGSTPTQLFNIIVKNCSIDGVAGFGVRIDYASNVRVENNDISYCGYAGITLLSVVHGLINGNRISNINSSAGSTNWYGVSLTRNETQTLANSIRSTNCVVSNNIISNVTKWTGIDIHAGYKCIVDSNQVYYCKNGMYAQYDDDTDPNKQPSENIIFSNNVVEGNAAAADSALGIASIGLSGMPNKDITIIGNQIINGGGFNSSNGGIFITETKNCIASNNIVKNSWRSAFSITGACDNIVLESNEFNGVQPDGSGSSTYYGYLSNTSMINVVLRNNRYFNNTGTSLNTPAYGIVYSAGTYSNVTLDKNRILNISTSSYLYNGTSGNQYQDFSWILEPTSTYDTGWTLTSGNTTETYNVTVRRDVRGTPATNTMVWTVNRQSATNPKVAVISTTQTSTTQYQLTAYTVDGSTFGAATNIPVMFTVHGICWTD